MPSTKPTKPASAQPASTNPPAPVRERHARRLDEATILARYPRAIAGTLRFEQDGTRATKQTIETQLDCGCRRRLATSDLWQVARCRECRRAERATAVAERAAARRAERATARVAARAPAAVAAA